MEEEQKQFRNEMRELSPDEKIQFIIRNSVYDISDIADILDLQADILSNYANAVFNKTEKLQHQLDFIYKVVLDLI